MTAAWHPGPNPPMSPASLLTAGVKRAGNRMLDVVLPPRCLKCGATVDSVGALCANCWPAVAFLAPPHCAACGLPFEFDLGPAALCGSCAGEHPVFERARAAFRYDEGSKDLILRFKHADRIDGAATFAGWMARAGAELVVAADIIAPVPLHRWRLVRRRYNQAAILANAISRAQGKLVVPDLLVRRRATPSQGHLGRSQRQRNVAGAFALHPQSTQVAAGARILLVDDVLTTGATATACAKALLNAGANAVDLLVLARVVRVQPN